MHEERWTTMRQENHRLVTVIAEAALERSLIQDLDRLGVGGYTITDARGRGSRGLRTSGWEHTSNIRLEVLCDAVTAERIVHHLRAHYEKNYAMTLWIQEAVT